MVTTHGVGRTAGMLLSAVVLSVGAVVVSAGSATAAPAGDPCSRGGHYTVIVGGESGCNKGPKGKELDCYKGAGRNATIGGASVGTGGAVVGGPAGAAAGAASGAVGGAVSGCLGAVWK